MAGEAKAATCQPPLPTEEEIYGSQLSSGNSTAVLKRVLSQYILPFH